MERRNPDEVLNEFLARNKAVVEAQASFDYNKFHESRQKTYDEGQKPSLTVIACSDSRVPVEEIFVAYPGEIFVIRTAGNVLDDIGKASLEYALDHLPTSVVLVLGHTKCGAVTSTVEVFKNGKILEGSHLYSLTEKIRPLVVEAIEEGASDENLIDKAIIKNAKSVVNEILTTMPIAKKLVEEGKVKILPAMYYLESGEVKLLD